MHITETDHFPAIMARVRDAAPDLAEAAVRHAANKITNEIRRAHCDCWNIEVSREPLSETGGSYILYQVEASGVILHVRQTVD